MSRGYRQPHGHLVEDGCGSLADLSACGRDHRLFTRSSRQTFLSDTIDTLIAQESLSGTLAGHARCTASEVGPF